MQQVGDLEPDLFRVGGAILGCVVGLVATLAVDALPRRHGVTHLVGGKRRQQRNLILVVLSTACWLGIAHVVAGAKELSIAHAALLLTTNGLAATSVLAGSAIDLEHMILPNELTIGPAVLCLATSPLRSIGFVSSMVGALVGLAIAYLPLLLYNRVRGRAGMGLGDAKLALMAGTWHGVLGVPFVLLLGALQSVLAAAILRLVGVTYEMPESVKAEIADLRKRAAAGDEGAKRDLDADPMAADVASGMLTMRLPLGPFLALACIEVLFLRRWLVENIVGWLLR